MPVPATQRWKDEVVKQFRYPGRVKMSLDIVADVSKADVVATGQNILPITKIGSTLDDQSPEYPEVATMEGIWRADGTMYLPSKVATENLVLPLWSDKLPSEKTPLVLNYNFGKAVSFIGLTFIWDTTYQSWAKKLRLYGYDQQGAVKYDTLVTDIDSVTSVIEYEMQDVWSIKAEVIEWSKPNLRARVSEVYFGIILAFNEHQIIDISENTKQFYMCSQLPVDTQRYGIKNQIYRSYVAPGAHATVNKSHEISDISRIFNATAATKGIATVETRYWEASGKLYLPSRVVSENPDIPWMSDNADFDADHPIELVVTYEDPVQINQVSMTWDVVTNSFPVDATIAGWDSYDNVVFSRDVHATSPFTTISDVYNTVKSVHVTIRKWSNPGWRARISQYEATLAYGNNNIPSEVNNLFDPTLETGYSKYLARRQRIKVQYGLDTYNEGTLWLPTQVRFLDAWDIPTDAIQVNFDSNTRLSFLTQEYAKGTYNSSGATFKQLALDVLQNSNIIRETAETIPWVLDDALDKLSTVAPLPVAASNALLQLIAGATGCTLGTLPDTGYVSISSGLSESEYIIGEFTQQQVPGVKLDAPLRSIAVNMYSYSIDSETKELFKGSISISGKQTLTIKYADSSCATDCQASVSGATVVSKTFYGYSAVLTLDAGATTKEVQVTITGRAVSTSNVQVTTFMDTEVESGRDVVIDNKLITNMDTVKVVAERALEYYKRRGLSSTTYLGYPDLKAGDRSALYSQFMNENGYITEHTFKYNGGFTGSLKMLMEV